MSEVSREAWVEWKQHPVTEELMSQLNDDLERMRLIYENDQVEDTLHAHANLIGRIYATKQMIEWNPLEEDE